MTVSWKCAKEHLQVFGLLGKPEARRKFNDKGVQSETGRMTKQEPPKISTHIFLN